MALTDVQTVTKPGKKGGGLLGSVLGGALGALAGAALAIPTGGASIPAGVAAGTAAAAPSAAAAIGAGALTGAGLGMTGGQLAGEAISPTEGAKQAAHVAQSESKRPSLMAMEDHPEVQLAQIQDAQKLIPQSNLPIDVRKQYQEQLALADQKLKSGLGIG